MKRILVCILLMVYQLASAQHSPLFSISQPGRGHGFINRQGQVVIAPQLEFEPRGEFSAGLCRVWHLKKKKFGFIDTTGKWVLPPVWEYAGGFAEGLVWVSRNDKVGYIDRSGRVVIDFLYETGDDFSEGLAAVELPNGQWGYIDRQGNMAIAPRKDFQLGHSFVEGRALMLNAQDKYGFIDTSGKWVIPPTYEAAESFAEGLAVVVLNDKYGVIDKQGNLQIAPIYQDIRDFSDGLAPAALNNHWGFIDTAGRWVIPPTYPAEMALDIALPSVTAFSEGLAGVKIKGKRGFINTRGELVIPALFDEGSGTFEHGLNYVVSHAQKNEYGWVGAWIDKQGRYVYKEQGFVEPR